MGRISGECSNGFYLNKENALNMLNKMPQCIEMKTMVGKYENVLFILCSLFRHSRNLLCLYHSAAALPFGTDT